MMLLITRQQKCINYSVYDTVEVMLFVSGCSMYKTFMAILDLRRHDINEYCSINLHIGIL